MQLHALVISLSFKRATSQFGPIIQNQNVSRPAFMGNQVQHFHHTLAGQ